MNEVKAAQRIAHQPPQARHSKRIKTHDLAREAVGCMGVFGAPVAVPRVANRMHQPHPHRTTPAQRAFGWDHAPLGSRSAQRAAI